MAKFVLATLVAFTIGIGSAPAETITVCAEGCDYTSIQAAVDAAGDGDLIRLAAETFSEGSEIRVEGKVLSIAGQLSPRGEPLTVVMGNGTHRLLRFTGPETEGAVVENISFQLGCDPAGENGGAGILADSAITCRVCEFIDNQAGRNAWTQGHGGGTRGPICHEGCLFLRNRAYYGGGSTEGTYNQCDFVMNEAVASSRAAAAPRGAAIFVSQSVQSCKFTGNTSFSTVASANLYDCVFLDGICYPNGAEIVRCRFEGESRLEFCDWTDCTQTATVIDCFFETTIGRPSFGCVFEGCVFEGEDAMPVLGGRFEDCIVNTGTPGFQFQPEANRCDNYLEPSFRNCLFQEACPADPTRWHDLGGNRFAGEMLSSCPFAYCNTSFGADGLIDASDLGELMSLWGLESYCDVDRDQIIGPAELGELLASWGECR